MSVVMLDLAVFTDAERRDLANSLLRAAWCAAMEEVRIRLLEASEQCDNQIHGNGIA